MYSKIILTFILLISLHSSCFAYWLILNKRVSVKEVSVEDVESLFIGKTKFLPFVDHPFTIGISFKEKSSGRIMLKELFGLTYREFQSVWRKKLFAGRGLPPVNIKRYDTLKEFMELNPYGVVLSDQESHDGYYTLKVIFKD